eukprot:gnl/TRDRNA2_/TRDRNA2_126877_c0_seq2.p1 gnl/TRDRNA2_/TRDRNA2_126877_c0~~gnl/TRDRNA2_/TRDRNA2_126877_c0_seq2.p1  ORF type:complete len:394 (-),score=47.43 gnl/TRDRNA2_/TRDRNA2_126877_c0_seq2:25-1086(-)
MWQKPFSHHVIGNRTAITVAEALAELQVGDVSVTGPLFVDGAYALARRLLPLEEGALNGSVLAKLLGGSARAQLGYVSLAPKGVWAPMHIHENAIFTQVIGSKGWVLAPAHAFPSHFDAKQPFLGFQDDYSDNYSDTNSADYLDEYSDDWDINNQQQICGLFQRKCTADAAMDQLSPRAPQFGNHGSPPKSGSSKEVPAGLTVRKSAKTPPRPLLKTKGLRCCELNAGSSLFFPGVGFWDGWWHGTCALDHWNAGFTFFPSRPQECHFYLKNGSFDPIELFWIQDEETGALQSQDLLDVGQWIQQSTWIGHHFRVGNSGTKRSNKIYCTEGQREFWYVDPSLTASIVKGFPEE